MAARFTYSRWDGTQRGFDLDADALLAEITDDLLYHGDVNAALRRMMNHMKPTNSSKESRLINSIIPLAQLLSGFPTI